MKFAKLLFFLAFSSFLFSGCNLPKSGGSPLRTTSPNTGLFPTSEPTLTSPYLIFEVQKMDLPENPDFVLMANGEEIDRVSLHTLDPYPGSSAQVYPPLQIPTMVLAPTSSPESPYPPLPEATPFPVDQTFDQAALAHIAHITGTSPGSLSLVETSTVLLPITQKNLWNGIIVQPNQNGGDVYQVLIDANRRIILSSLNFNPQTYWEEAEYLFRQANQDSILSQISRQNNIPTAELSIVNGVFHSYPFTQTIIWHGTILSKGGNDFDYAVSLDGKPVDERRFEVKESEARRLKYGKLGENLYYILQAIPNDHSVEVVLVTAGSDPGGIEEKLILIYLKALGYEPRDIAGVNVIAARMTKRDILLLSQAPLDSLGSIHYNGQIPQP